MPSPSYNDINSHSDTESNIEIGHDEIETFFRVGKKLDCLTTSRGIPIMAMGRICKALDKLSSFPIIAFDHPKSGSYLRIYGKYVDDEQLEPYRMKLDLILAKSSPENIVGCTGEHSTRRIVGGDSVEFGYCGSWSIKAIEDTIAAKGFLYRTLSRVTCKIRNLCIYSPGSSLDWRREVPQSDNHLGTALVALNTDWTGGCVLLRRNGIEIRHATPRQVVFFDIETEYAIEPVTGGNLVLLHYDVLVRDWIFHPQIQLAEDDEYPTYDETDHESLFRRLKSLRRPYLTEDTHPRGFLYGVDHEKGLERILRIVKKLLLTEYHAVGLALHHHYGARRIPPELLQQPDTAMYEAVVACGSLDVFLRPILLHQVSDNYGTHGEPFAYLFDQPTSTDGDTEEAEQMEVAWEIPKSVVLFVHSAAALTEVAAVEFVEAHRPGYEKYFAWAMFLTLKDRIDDGTRA